jgi:cell wall assembly regulator SMI1
MEHNPARAERTLAAWVRIEAWLRRHAPQTHAALPGPAEPSAVEEAEAALGDLPPELRALWSVLGGGSGPDLQRLGVLRGYDVLPPSMAVWCRVNVLDGILEVEEMGSRPWVPACANERFEPYLWNFIDVPTGDLGSNVHAGAFIQPGESGETFTTWIEGVADELHGGPAKARVVRAGISDGSLLWTDPRDPRRTPSDWAPVGPA